MDNISSAMVIRESDAQREGYDLLHLRVAPLMEPFIEWCIENEVPDFDLPSGYIIVERHRATRTISAIYASDYDGTVGQRLWQRQGMEDC